jgi:hypothetical protein
MAYKFYNPNPKQRFVSDCTIRAICLLTDQDWDSVYVGTTFEGFLRKNMPSGNDTWGSYLDRLGYFRKALPDTCPFCYTVKDFCNDHPQGKYLLALDQHVVAVKDGDYYDTWDSGNEIPFYYWTKGE